MSHILKNRITKLILINIAPFIINGCIGYYERMSNLSENQIEWFKVYKPNDTILFHSNTQPEMVDTMIIDQVVVMEPPSRFYLHYIDNIQGPVFNAHAYYKYVIKSYNDSIKGMTELMNYVGRDTLAWTLYLGGLWNTKDFGFPTSIYTDPIPTVVRGSYEVDNIIIDSCLIVNDKSGMYSRFVSIDSIKEFVISKEYGLISYTKSIGGKYTRTIP